MENTSFIIDFDSTFVTVEALDELASISLENNPKKKQILNKIKNITKLGMEGKIDFPASLAKRLSLFKPTQEDNKKLVEFLKTSITPSVTRNKKFFLDNRENIYIISGGFLEYILPVVKDFGIEKSHVLANNFITDNKKRVTGFNKSNPLAQISGKAKAVKNLGLSGQIIVIGDGYTDYEIVKTRIGHKFYAFTENISREKIKEKANLQVKNFDELLFNLNIPRSISYPKSRINALLLENVHPNALEQFNKEGYTVTSLKSSLNEDELIEKITNISILGIGSRTQITKSLLASAKKLLAISRFGIGTNNIDLTACLEYGVAVFNAPFSNTRSVVELTLGEIILLYRRIFEKNEKLHKGIWDKSANNCHELRNKTLGIIGYGNIGSQLSVLAEAIGMQVIFYDLEDKLALGKARQCQTLNELLQNSDAITLHVDGRKENTNLIGEEQFKQMKEGAIFINTSRGHVVDIQALVKNLKSGKILGASCDVFPNEPKSNDETFESPLQGLPNVILTPHIGGRSLEAQAHMGNFVPEKVIQFINTGSTTLSVNFPALSLPEQKNTHRFIHIHNNIPGMLAKINNVFANEKVNIVGQYLKTNEHIGYVITDVATTSYSEQITKNLKSIPDTIRVRILY